MRRRPLSWQYRVAADFGFVAMMKQFGGSWSRLEDGIIHNCAETLRAFSPPESPAANSRFQRCWPRNTQCSRSSSFLYRWATRAGLGELHRLWTQKNEYCIMTLIYHHYSIDRIVLAWLGYSSPLVKRGLLSTAMLFVFTAFGNTNQFYWTKRTGYWCLHLASQCTSFRCTDFIQTILLHTPCVGKRFTIYIGRARHQIRLSWCSILPITLLWRTNSRSLKLQSSYRGEQLRGMYNY